MDQNMDYSGAIGRDLICGLRLLENRYVAMRASADGSLLRYENYFDVRYLVVPIVSAVGDQVWWPVNAATPELVPASVLAANAISRNGRPVVMGHPKVSGDYVSANSPDVMSDYCFGFMFNSMFADGRIKVEAYLDPLRAEAVGPSAVRVIERLEAGEMVEVSEGNFVVTVAEDGVFGGQKYGARWITAVSDHLAILDEDQIGACNNKMGCGGPRVNEAVAGESGASIAAAISSSSAITELRASALSQARRPSFTGTETSAWSKPTFADYIKYLDNSDTPPTSVSSCSAELKRKIAAHTLLGDPDATAFADLSLFPVVNPTNDKLNENALRAVIGGRGSQADISEKALASAQEIARRLLNSEFAANISTSADTSTNESSATLATSAIANTATVMISDKKTTNKEGKMNNKKTVKTVAVNANNSNIFSRMLASIRNSTSNNDLRFKLYEAIAKEDPHISWVEDEDVATGKVIYCVVTRFGDYYDTDLEYHWYERSFTIAADDTVTVDTAAQEIEFFQGWRPVDTMESADSTPALETSCACDNTNNAGNIDDNGTIKGGSVMAVSEKAKNLVGSLITSSISPFEEGDRSVLEAMSESRLESLAEKFKDTAPMPPVTASAASAGFVASSTPGQVLLTQEEYSSIKAASDAYAAQQVARKTVLVSSLSTAQTAFTEVELAAMDTPVLEKLASAFKIDMPATVDYSIRGIPMPSVSASNSIEAHAPRDTWSLALAKEKERAKVAN